MIHSVRGSLSLNGGARTSFVRGTSAPALLIAVVSLAAVASVGCGRTPAVAGANDSAVPLPSEAWWRGADGSDRELIRCPLTDTVSGVEETIILPRCGAAGDNTCHASGPVAPRMAEVGKIAQNLVELSPELNCPGDKLVSRDDPASSDLLAKVRARGTTARCSNGAYGGPGMPYQDAPQLTAAEASCLEWWVHQIAQ